jgi:hypothetical protein
MGRLVPSLVQSAPTIPARPGLPRRRRRRPSRRQVWIMAASKAHATTTSRPRPARKGSAETVTPARHPTAVPSISATCSLCWRTRGGLQRGPLGSPGTRLLQRRGGCHHRPFALAHEVHESREAVAAYGDSAQSRPACASATRTSRMSMDPSGGPASQGGLARGLGDLS